MSGLPGPLSAPDLTTLKAVEAVRSVYLHIPFCQRRCGYCDFAIIAGRSELIPRYLQALEQELRLQLGELNTPLPLETLYVGGGTPTLLTAAELQQFLELLQPYFQWHEKTEFTFEANPDLFLEEKQELLARAGVNRISLGVQSFDNSYLQLLERTHSSRDTFRVIEQIQSRFENVSFDLIFALPGQSLTHWEQTLQQAVALAPQHISAYSLTYEKGTSFWGKRNRGEFSLIPDQDELEMYTMTLNSLPAAGYSQYEISNFAQPGYSSRHNEAYWTGKPYLAFGPGASRFVDRRRSTNHRSAYTWMKRLEAGESPVDYSDELLPEERARELLAIGLRRNQGVAKTMLEQTTGVNVASLLKPELDELKQRGWLEEDLQHYRLTDAGRLFADEIAATVI